MQSICRQLGWWTLGIVVAIPRFALGNEIAVFMAAPAAQPPPAQPQTPTAQPEKPKPPRPHPTLPMLHLTTADYFPGTLPHNPNPNTIRWQAIGATEPFEFGPDSVRSAYFAPPAVRPLPKGEYCIELTEGDILCGSLVAITKDEYEIDSAQFGHLK